LNCFKKYNRDAALEMIYSMCVSQRRSAEIKGTHQDVDVERIYGRRPACESPHCCGRSYMLDCRVRQLFDVLCDDRMTANRVVIPLYGSMVWILSLLSACLWRITEIDEV